MQNEVIWLSAPDGFIRVEVIRSKRKTVALRVLPGKQVQVSAPLKVSLQTIQDFVNEKTNWVLQKLNQLDQGIYLPQMPARELKENKQALLKEVRTFYAEQIPVWWQYYPEKIRVGSAKTRWGSCSSKGTICLNVALIQIPKSLREYVFCHELCHLAYPHHQAGFWQALERLYPGAKKADKELKKYYLPFDGA